MLEFKRGHPILDSIADGVFTVDSDFKITSFNRAAEEITGYDRSEAIGRPCSEVFRANVCKSNCVLCRSIETGRQLVNVRVDIHNRMDERVLRPSMVRVSAGPPPEPEPEPEPEPDTESREGGEAPDTESL